MLIDNQTYRLEFAKERIPKLETLNFSERKNVGFSTCSAPSKQVCSAWHALANRFCGKPYDLENPVIVSTTLHAGARGPEEGAGV